MKSNLLQRVVSLLDECEAALIAAHLEVSNPDLKIACRDRSRRCKTMIQEIKADEKPKTASLLREDGKDTQQCKTMGEGANH